MSVRDKFARLGTDNAPGQEVRQKTDGLHDAMRGGAMRGGVLEGRPVDFSHGDVDAFTPTPGAFEAFAAGFARGGAFNRKYGNKLMQLRLLLQFIAVILIVLFVWISRRGG